jgi:hypothetical protein
MGHVTENYPWKDDDADEEDDEVDDDWSKYPKEGRLDDTLSIRRYHGSHLRN